MEYIYNIVFDSAGNKTVLPCIDLYSYKRTEAGDDIFRRIFRNTDTGKKWHVYANDDDNITAL